MWKQWIWLTDVAHVKRIVPFSPHTQLHNGKETERQLPGDNQRLATTKTLESIHISEIFELLLSPRFV